MATNNKEARTKAVGIRIDVGLHESMSSWANQNGVTFSWTVNRILKREWPGLKHIELKWESLKDLGKKRAGAGAKPRIEN